VQGVEDGYVIGGEIAKNEEYGELQFSDFKAADVRDWLASIDWNTDQVFLLIRTIINT